MKEKEGIRKEGRMEKDGGTERVREGGDQGEREGTDSDGISCNVY